ncbi:hypothetical protein OG210_21900 [Streptomyces sp. NBC_00466]|uniref:hypothetical protein n=1 Tax=Streptomyces sp. NBC_00466 TaxID=2903655 RepID=UPI0030E252A8
METAYFMGEGGHVWEMDLPLSEQHARAHGEGRLVRVNQDGTAHEEHKPEPASKDSGGKRVAKAPAKTEEKT